MSSIENAYTELAKNSGELCAFMLVCQLGKLSVAADKMKVSQPSMSLKIKNLESSLGRELFIRKSNGLTLSYEGEKLLELIQAPMELLALNFEGYRHETKTDRVVISVDHAFASFWLLPRLPLLREALGTTDICLITSQEPIQCATPETDITIYMSGRDDVAKGSKKLIQECVSVICSPEFRRRHPISSDPRDFFDSELPLLHVNTPARKAPWLDWDAWLKFIGVDFKSLSGGTVFNSYEMIVKAARDGQGIALGWHGLVDDLLASGELVELYPNRVCTEAGYYIKNSARHRSRKVEDVLDWIVEQVGDDNVSSSDRNIT